MIRAAPPTEAARSFSQDAAKTHADPAVDLGEDDVAAVFEILKPALGRAVDVRNDHVQTAAIGAPGLTPDRLPKLRQTLVPWVAMLPHEMIAQEVEARRS